MDTEREIIYQHTTFDIGDTLAGILREFGVPILQTFNSIQEKLDKIMATQADLEALVASESADLSAIGDSLTAINDAVKVVSDEVAAIIAAAPAGLDLTTLQAAQADLDAKAAALNGVAASITAIVPATPPAPVP